MLLFTKLDRKLIMNNCKQFAEELAKCVFNPVRIMRIYKMYEFDMEQYFNAI